MFQTRDVFLESQDACDSWTHQSSPTMRFAGVGPSSPGRVPEVQYKCDSRLLSLTLISTSSDTYPNGTMGIQSIF